MAGHREGIWPRGPGSRASGGRSRRRPEARIHGQCAASTVSRYPVNQLSVSEALFLSVSLSACSLCDEDSMAYPESEVGQALGQARQRLEAGTSLGDESKRRRRTSEVPAGVLDALGLAGLVLE